MFRSPSFCLLAVTACLLGGCEKREAAPAEEREHRSSGRSSLRASDEAFRGGDRREYTSPQDVLKAIRRLPQLDFSEENGFGADEDYNVLTQAEDAIKSAGPAQFDAIMKEIAQLEDSMNRGDLRAVAIFHLVAGQDLLRAGEIALKLLPPGDDRSTLLKSLVFGTWPSATKAWDFWRSLPVEEQSEVSEYVFIQASVDLGAQGLVKWKDEGYRLNEDETFRMMKAMIIGSVSSGSAPQEEASEYPDLITSIAPLEKEGVLSKGAADELMLQYLIHQEELGGEKVEFLGMPGTQARVEELGKDGFDSLYSRIAAERPHRFFTGTGIHDLPEEKVFVAWKGWLGADPAAAREWWFGESGEWLAPAVRDFIRAGFANHALGEGNAEAAREWGSQIHDPELRAETLSRVPEGQ